MTRITTNLFSFQQPRYGYASGLAGNWFWTTDRRVSAGWKVNALRDAYPRHLKTFNDTALKISGNPTVAASRELKIFNSEREGFAAALSRHTAAVIAPAEVDLAAHGPYKTASPDPQLPQRDFDLAEEVNLDRLSTALQDLEARRVNVQAAMAPAFNLWSQLEKKPVTMPAQNGAPIDWKAAEDPEFGDIKASAKALADAATPAIGGIVVPIAIMLGLAVYFSRSAGRG